MSTAGPLGIVFITQDGARISGITTYGCTLARNDPDVHVVFLNEEKVPVEAGAFKGRCSVVEPARSHDVAEVARRLAACVSRMEHRRVIIMPNTGDTPYAAAVATLALLTPAERKRTRVLGTAHGDHANVYFLLHYYRRFLSAITAVSERCASELRERLADWTGPLIVLPCPVEPPTMRARPADGPLRLVYCGRLEEGQKRVSRLAQVCARLEYLGIPTVLTIVGAGPAETDLRSQLGGDAGRRHVQVVWHGPAARTQVQALLCAQDVFLLVSAYEGTPLALLEAMAVGLCPVLMRTESGIPDVVTSGEDGLIVEQGDTVSMAEAIATLDRDRARLERLKDAATRSVLERYSVQRHLARLKELGERCFDRDEDPVATSAPPLPQSAFVAEMLDAAVRDDTGLVAVFGAGMFGRKLIDAAFSRGLPVARIVDSDTQRQGTLFRGIEIGDPESLPSMAPTQVLIGSVDFAAEMVDQVTAIFARASRPMPRIVRAMKGSIRGE